MDNKLEDKRFSTKWQQAFPDFNLLFTQDPVGYSRKVLKWIWIEFVTVEVESSVSDQKQVTGSYAAANDPSSLIGK